MRNISFLSLATVSVLAATALTGCEAVNSAGTSINNWAKQNITAKGETTPAGGTVEAPGTNKELLAKTDPNCPQVKVLGELSSITQFSNPKAPDAASEIADARLEDISAKCEISANSVSMEISLDFTGTLGPLGLKDLNGQANYTYPYFLSVITPTGQILSKDVFALSIAYDKGNMTIRKQDRLRQIIPLMPGQTANQFQIVAGFQLGEDELSYNRSQKSVEPSKK